LVLSKRERLVAILAVTTLLILGVDYIFLSPLMAKKDELDLQIAEKRELADQATQLFRRRREANVQWKEMTSGGFYKDSSEADIQLQNRLNDWGQEAGLTITQIKPERTDKEKDFYRVTMRVQGTGGMKQIGQFLWRIQTATGPVRITEVQINMRGKEGTDDLSLSLGVSTISLIPESEKQNKSPTASASSAMREMIR
jgi:Tfp pilus assembly protein PilO